VRIVVAGCAGFIGSNLALRLLSEGHQVVGVDNFLSGRRGNVDELSQHKGFEFVEADIREPLQIQGPVEQIYNEACPASPVDFAAKRLEILQTCARGVWNLLELARTKQARLLHSSTSEVYGDPQVHPQPETYWGHVNPIGPRSCYDEGKRYAEALITAYAAEHDDVSVRVARIFNTYGPRMRKDDGRALPTFIEQALRGEPLTVHGDGSQTRSFCYVDDQVEGQIRLMNSDLTGPVNIGNPAEVTIREIAEEIITAAGSSSRVVCVARPQDDPELRRPDISRAQAAMGWTPQVDRGRGLAETVRWFRSRIDASSDESASG
jgi:dTDP-glucose 4,6-dehydratase